MYKCISNSYKLHEGSSQLLYSLLILFCLCPSNLSTLMHHWVPLPSAYVQQENRTWKRMTHTLIHTTHKCSSYLSIYIPSIQHLNFLFIYYITLFLLGLQLQHVEVPRSGAESELQLWAYTTATLDPSHICGLCCSLQQHQIFNLLSKARDPTHVLMDNQLDLFLLCHNGNSQTDITSKIKIKRTKSTQFPPGILSLKKYIYNNGQMSVKISSW